MRLLLFLIVAVVSFGGSAIAQVPYQGPMFDAHAHLSKRASAEQGYDHIIGAGFDKVAFFVDVERIGEVAKFASDKIHVFVDPFKRKKVKVGGGKKEVRYAFSNKRLAAIETALKAGRAVGFGEIYFRLGYAPFAEQG
ncbi:hypothetical protein ACFL12_08860, partial [Pseudomonadota bacterium]